MPETKRRLQVSPSLVISIFALVIAMSAGAYAATIAPKNSVVSKSIKNKNVKSADIKPGAVKKKHLGNNSVDSSRIADGSVTGADIGDGQVPTSPTSHSAAATTDLNDAATLGGLTVAQLVAAAGGEYYEARQAAGSVDVETVTPATVATLNLPHAGKYLINARIPVTCTYDDSDGAVPDDPNPNQPAILARGTLSVGAAVVDNVEACLRGRRWPADPLRGHLPRDCDRGDHPHGHRDGSDHPDPEGFQRPPACSSANSRLLNASTPRPRIR